MSPNSLFSTPPTKAEWEGMKSVITDIWLTRAHNNNDLINILRREYGFVATKKTSSTRLQEWGLSTYRKKATPNSPQGSRNPMRKRKAPRLEHEAGPRPLRLIMPSPAINCLLRPEDQPPILMKDSIDRFVAISFGNSVHQFTYVDLMRPKLSERLRWDMIAELYCTAESNFRAEHMKKFVKTLKQAHQELRVLLRWDNPWTGRLLAKCPSASHRLKQDMNPLPMDAQRARNHAFIAQFWRLCHKLLRKDMEWPRYEFSFVTDLLLELEKILLRVCGKYHPLHDLLFALSLARKADMQDILKLGVCRTIEVMGSGITSRKKMAMVSRWWTADMYCAR